MIGIDAGGGGKGCLRSDGTERLSEAAVVGTHQAKAGGRNTQGRTLWELQILFRAIRDQEEVPSEGRT